MYDCFGAKFVIYLSNDCFSSLSCETGESTRSVQSLNLDSLDCARRELQALHGIKKKELKDEGFKAVAFYKGSGF